VHLRCADRLGTGTTTLDEATGERDALLARIGTIADDPVTVVAPQGLAINGKILMRELGLPQGKRIGILLRALFDLVLDDPTLNTEERLLRFARQAAFDVDYLTQGPRV
jgi:tRNA nucleotidyltransferase (CCA-adding enzyme)